LSSSDILVLNADHTVRSYLQTLLEEAGFTAQAVPNATEAIRRIRQEKPQLVLMDVLLPDMTGQEFCRIIKQDLSLSDIVLFILTSQADLETKLACFSCGAEEYLVRPVDSRELIARIGRLIRLIDRLKTPPAQVAATPVIPPKRSKKGAREKAAKEKLAQLETPKAPELKTPVKPSVEIASLALSDYSFLQFQTTYGVYRVESLVGKGGMGQVYKARDELLERYVAIKVLASKLSESPEFVERFRREAKVLASINHAGIASIYSFSEQKGEHYFAMQWCSGGSVAELIKKKSIDALNAVDIILQCARALSAASKKGIVHRDIKPSNLMFDENQLIKLVDFGLAYAQQISTNLTQGSEFLGTPSYMAPEQAKSPSVDHRADIYSLGITFYHMLYGRLPYEATSAVDMVIKHSTQAFPTYDDFNGKISRSIYRIVEKMTQKDAASRYQDYPSLITDLEHVRNELFNQRQLKVPRMGSPTGKPSLTSANFFEMLAILHNIGEAGVLRVRWSGLQKHYLVRNSEIILFESTQIGENIWLALAEKNLMKNEDVPPAGADMESKLNRFLLNQLFSLEDFKKTYRELMKSSLSQVFLWPIFEGEFTSASVEHEAFSSIKIADFLMEAAHSILDYDALKSEVSQQSYLARTNHFDDVLRTLPLNPEESFVASRLEGENMTVDTLNMLAGVSEDKIIRLLYALRKFGALEIREPGQKFKKPDSGKFRVPGVVLHPGGQFESSNVDFAKSDTAKFRRSDIPQKAQLPGTEPALRDQYLAEMGKKRSQSPQQEGMIRMEVQKSDKKIELEQHVKEAEMFYKVAEKKFEDGYYYDVTTLCRQAIANNPGEAKYYLLMAIAYSKHPKFVKDAEISFQKAVDIDPWNPELRLQLAEFYIEQGLSKRALTECSKILEITPQHPKALELYKQLAGKHRQ
jgi:CheY-like chemotaxis protein/tRNA A-37 threonylcarbamoyl transferase component Bud32